MDNIEEKLLDIYKSEYEKLKAEQLQRIAFRDVTIPFSIFISIAPILSAAFAKDSPYGYSLLLVVPWICLSLGWAYIANDEKVTTIGDYIRENLKRNISLVLDKLQNNEQQSETPEKSIYRMGKIS